MELLCCQGVLKGESKTYHSVYFRRYKMLSRLSLMFTLVAALAAGVVTTNVAAQKDKTKSKDQAESKEQKEKDKTLFDSNNGLVALELDAGGGGYLGVYLEE